MEWLSVLFSLWRFIEILLQTNFLRTQKICPNHQCGAVWTNEILELSSSAVIEEGEFIPTISLSETGHYLFMKG